MNTLVNWLIVNPPPPCRLSSVI